MAILSNGRRCPNAALPNSRYCGLESHQALAGIDSDNIADLSAEQGGEAPDAPAGEAAPEHGGEAPPSPAPEAAPEEPVATVAAEAPAADDEPVVAETAQAPEQAHVDAAEEQTT